MGKIKILLDASVMKHSVDRRIVGHEETQTRRFAGKEFEVPVVRWTEESPHARLDEAMREQVRWLALVAHLARRERIELLAHMEAMDEFWGLPDTRDTRGLFQGAPVGSAPDPIRYSRVIYSYKESARQLRHEFLESLTHPRFLELQKVTGANNPGPRRGNQLADTFHIWTAEEAGLNYLLTTDRRLVNSAAVNRPERPRVPVVRPEDLIKELLRSRTLRLRDVLSWIWFALRTRRRGPADHPEEQLLQLSRRLADGE